MFLYTRLRQVLTQLQRLAVLLAGYTLSAVSKVKTGARIGVFQQLCVAILMDVGRSPIVKVWSPHSNDHRSFKDSHRSASILDKKSSKAGVPRIKRGRAIPITAIISATTRHEVSLTLKLRFHVQQSSKFGRFRTAEFQ